MGGGRAGAMAALLSNIKEGGGLTCVFASEPITGIWIEFRLVGQSRVLEVVDLQTG